MIGSDGLILTIGYLILEADAIQVTTHDNRVIPARPGARPRPPASAWFARSCPCADPAGRPGSAGGIPPQTPLIAATGGEDGGIGVTQLVGNRPFSGYWEYHIESALFTSPPLRNHSGASLFSARGELLGIGSLFVGNALGDNRPAARQHVRAGGPAQADPGGDAADRQHPHQPSTLAGPSSTEQGGRVQIIRVSRESPAQDAGLAPGDVVLAIDDEKVSTLEGFYKKLWARTDPDAEVRLTVLQGADVRQVTVKAVDRMKMMRKPSGI